MSGPGAARRAGPGPPTLLLTCFGPFHGKAENASERLVRAQEARLREALGGWARLHVERLPVVWGAPEPRLRGCIEALAPIAVLMLGEWDGDGFRVERRARRHRVCTRDEAGRPGRLAPPRAGLPEAYETRVDVAALAGTGPDVAISDDAGGFLCEEAFYFAMHWARRLAPEGVEIPVAFVHVPRAILGRPAGSWGGAFEGLVERFLAGVGPRS